MNKLVNKVAEKFNGKVIFPDTVEFSFGDDLYCLTDGTLYAVMDDGGFLPGCKKVRSLLDVENFVAAHS